MGGSTLYIALSALGAGVLGVAIGWLVRGVADKRRIAQLIGEGRKKLDEVTRQRDQFAAEYSKLRSAKESLQAEVAKDRTELKSAFKKFKLLTKKVRNASRTTPSRRRSRSARCKMH